jgi:hypothetical protein
MRLEAAVRPAPAPVISILWSDDLAPCREHTRCEVEPETGLHHRNVIHLSFGARQ